MRGDQRPRSRHHAKGALGLDRVDIADLVALQNAEVDGLAGLGGEFLHHRPGLLSHVQGTDDGQSHLDQRGSGDVGAGDRLLLDEAVVGEHREQSVRRRVGDAEIFAGVGEPHPRLFTEQKKQKERVVHRGDGVGRASIALRSCLLHRRSLPPTVQVFADSPRHTAFSK